MGKKGLTPIDVKSARKHSNPRSHLVVKIAEMLRNRFNDMELLASVNYAMEIVELIEKELYDGQDR